MALFLLLQGISSVVTVQMRGSVEKEFKHEDCFFYPGVRRRGGRSAFARSHAQIQLIGRMCIIIKHEPMSAEVRTGFENFVLDLYVVSVYVFFCLLDFALLALLALLACFDCLLDFA